MKANDRRLSQEEMDFCGLEEVKWVSHDSFVYDAPVYVFTGTEIYISAHDMHPMSSGPLPEGIFQCAHRADKQVRFSLITKEFLLSDPKMLVKLIQNEVI